MQVGIDLAVAARPPTEEPAISNSGGGRAAGRSINDGCEMGVRSFVPSGVENGAPGEIRTPDPQIRSLDQVIEIVQVCYGNDQVDLA